MIPVEDTEMSEAPQPHECESKGHTVSQTESLTSDVIKGFKDEDNQYIVKT